jgi:hypothetical protein
MKKEMPIAIVMSKKIISWKEIKDTKVQR